MTDNLVQVAHQAFVKSILPSTESLPMWENITEDLQTAWKAAVRAVIDGMKKEQADRPMQMRKVTAYDHCGAIVYSEEVSTDEIDTVCETLESCLNISEIVTGYCE